MGQKKLISVLGPTAVGKTALAIALAAHFETEILSCDARQFFKEMTIGTAVPTADQLAAVTHHFIQHKSIFDPYSVGHFESDARSALDELFQKKDIALLVGGSGLYEKAVTEGLDYFPKTTAKTRKKLNKIHAEQGIVPLQQQLQKEDPAYWDEVDPKNAKRLIRALEVCIDTGSPYSSYRKKKVAKRDFETLRIIIDIPRTRLCDRINRRVDQMFDQGLESEAEKLYPYRNRNALQTPGYRELFLYLEGKIDLGSAKAAIQKNTRRYAKRQVTWLRNQIREAQWHGPPQFEKIIRVIAAKTT